MRLETLFAWCQRLIQVDLETGQSYSSRVFPSNPSKVLNLRESQRAFISFVQSIRNLRCAELSSKT